MASPGLVCLIVSFSLIQKRQQHNAAFLVLLTDSDPFVLFAPRIVATYIRNFVICNIVTYVVNISQKDLGDVSFIFITKSTDYTSENKTVLTFEYTD